MSYFSIIIPTYNSSVTIHRCIESVVNQTYKDIEILIIDGVSQDATLDIVRTFNDVRITILSEPDKGIYDAMNKGVKKSKGEWLYFLGSDDKLFDNSILFKVYNYILNSDLHVIYGNVVSARFNGLYAGEFNYSKLYYQNICHQAILFNRLVFSKIGCFDLKYKSHADYDHNIKWFLNKHINKLYVEETIADYADGGFSSQNGDELFEKDKNFRFICSGLFTLPKHFLLDICRKRSYSFKEYILFNTIKNVLIIRRLLKKCLTMI